MIGLDTKLKILSIFVAITVLCCVHRIAFADQPNVLFIAVDDLNDWVGCLGGHPQSVTPNLDRLAASGVLFRNAYCPAPSCNPSRAAIFSSLPPHQSGLYQNMQKLWEVMPQAELLPKYFSKHGYWSASSGKMLHYVIDPQSWDDYFPSKEKDNPFPRTFQPAKRPVNLPRAGNWQYVETDWASLDVSDREYGGDWLVTKWIIEQLSKPSKMPYFLACGIFRPHEPWLIRLVWLDENGKRHEPIVIASASRYLIKTFAGHTLVLLDEDDKYIGHIVTSDTPARVIVQW